jgi:hypothetical protein
VRGVAVDLAALLPSWELHLRAERKSPETVKSYGDGVRRFLAWADGEGRPAVLDRASVNAFTADLLEAGGEPATARARQLASGASPRGCWRRARATPTICSASGRPSWTRRSSSR